LRIGTSALTTRGFDADDMREVGKVIAAALMADDFEAEREALRERTRALAEKYPLYPQLTPAAA
ncbi:MAG: serine hydroxymethyltransferase, partial [bacterium]